MKKIALLILLLSGTASTFAQQSSPQWRFSQPSAMDKPVLQPLIYRYITIDEGDLFSALSAVPADANVPGTIQLPQPDGSMRAFLIWETPIMEQPLADKYPGIRTFTASAVDNHRATAKIDYTPFGFHAMVADGQNSYFIDPFGKSADGRYIVYYRKDYEGTGAHVVCGVGNDITSTPGLSPLSISQSGLPQIAFRMNGTLRRTYRLALTCTGEYAVAVAGPNPTKGAVLAKMVTTVNRVNSVYERDLAINLQLVGNNDTLIFLNGGTDPFDNANALSMLTKNQDIANAYIKAANYDIGHIFATGGGGGAGAGLGFASVSVTCDDQHKAEGVTGTPTPTGDGFDIDYVAHEMGHQFGAEHTFNSLQNGSCASNNNRGQPTAYEPGSGSTIMAYAGICGSDDLQPHTDPYFHSASLEQITTYVTTATCGAISATANTNATLPPYSASYNIPYLTAFELTAPAAVDANADTLTYCWEQRDLGDFGKTLPQTRRFGPLFRSFRPTTDRTRIFPCIDSLLKSVFISAQEKIPDTSRTLTFRVTERDIYQGYGAFNFPDDSIRLNVIRTGAPFRVTSPNANTNWAGGSTQTVLWNVANTDAAPISCTGVNIFLSTDGGYTFPTILSSNTPNDGSEAVTLPNVNTTNLRIKVKGAGNVFFAISHTTPPTGIDKHPMNEGGVTISPVPATNRLEISFVRPGEAALAKIVNAVGQLMWMGRILDRQFIDVSGWAKGVYFIRLSNDSTINVARPVIVQ